MDVDTYRHVITHIQADLADERDSRHLMAIVDKLSIKLMQYGLPFQYLLPDAGFSSGENGPATSVHRLRAACAYNLQKLLTHIHHPKSKVQSIPLQQRLILYFMLLCVVQQLRVVIITIGKKQKGHRLICAPFLSG